MRRYWTMGLMTLGLFAGTAAAGEMTGWIVDAWCGASNANSSQASRDCAKDCIKKGAAPAFVSEKEQKVYRIANGDAAKTHLDHKVKVSGRVEGETLTIASIVAAK
ncbi:MAG: hypothetical protein ACKV22_00160 [Bryobacteraceae bacterium]